MLSTAVAPGALQAATVSYLADIAQMSEGLDEPGFTVRHQCYSVRLLPPDLVSGWECRGESGKGGWASVTPGVPFHPRHIASSRRMHCAAADTSVGERRGRAAKWRKVGEGGGGPEAGPLGTYLHNVLSVPAPAVRVWPSILRSTAGPICSHIYCQIQY